MKLIAVISHDNYCSQFITFFVNWYNNRLLPLLRQFSLTADGINMFIDLTFCLNYFCQDLIPACWLHFSTSKELGSGTNSYFYLLDITHPIYIQQPREVLLPLFLYWFLMFFFLLFIAGLLICLLDILFFIPEMPTGFTSYIIHITPIHFAWIL
jgi:hypothetical protein